ncbi:D-3-phosphoglycerate dehydrogenase 2 [Spatholobus suberectus]|nr:D-3-phosphoglycerate dehydrogenase 2 [Spatholobus suberectus]
MKMTWLDLMCSREEPPPKDCKLVQHENVTVTPHLGASTKEAQEGISIEIAEAVVRALKGELSATAVNAPAVAPQVMSELGPYVVLAEKLGRLIVQLVSGGSRINQKCEGALSISQGAR